MNAYILALLAGLAGLAGHSLAGGLALELFLRRDLMLTVRRAWLAVSLGCVMLGLQQGYSLELALRTGLYDLRQAVLGGLAGVLLAIAVMVLRRRA
jgi:hypothetical protein